MPAWAKILMNPSRTPSILARGLRASGSMLDRVLDALLLHLRLGQPDGRDLGQREDVRRHPAQRQRRVHRVAERVRHRQAPLHGRDRRERQDAGARRRPRRCRGRWCARPCPPRCARTASAGRPPPPARGRAVWGSSRPRTGRGVPSTDAPVGQGDARPRRRCARALGAGLGHDRHAAGLEHILEQLRRRRRPRRAAHGRGWRPARPRRRATCRRRRTRRR